MIMATIRNPENSRKKKKKLKQKLAFYCRADVGFEH